MIKVSVSMDIFPWNCPDDMPIETLQRVLENEISLALDNRDIYVDCLDIIAVETLEDDVEVS